MRRGIPIAVGVGLAATGAALWLAAREATTILVRWQPEIERRAGAVAGGPVTIGGMSVTVFPTAEIVLHDVAVGGGARDAAVRTIAVRARWLPLLRGRVEVSHLDIDGLRLDVHRDAGGIAVSGAPRAPAVAGKAVEATRGALRDHESLGMLLGLTLQRVRLRDGTVRYGDPPRRLDFELRDIGVDTRVAVTPQRIDVPLLSGSATLATALLTWQGRDATLDLASGVASVPRLDLMVAGQALAATVRYDGGSDATVVTLDGDGLALQPLQPVLAQLVPGVAALQPRGTASAHLRTTIAAGDASPHVDGTLALRDATLDTPAGAVADVGGTFQVKADAQAGHLASADFALRWRDAPLRAAFAADTTFVDARLHDATLQAFGGTVTATGSFGIHTGQYQLDATAQDVDVAPALAVVVPAAPRVVTGHVRRLTTHVGGVVGPTALAALRGDGRIEIADGRIVGSNLGQQVFRAIDGVPVVGHAVRAALPPELEAVIAGDDTAMTTLQASYAIADRTLRFTSLALGNAAFTVDGAGDLTFGGQLDFRGTFRLTPAVTSQLVARVQELKLVVGNDGRIGFPVRVSGPIDRLRVKPDLAKLGLSSDANQLIDKAQDVLRGLFGGHGLHRQK